MIPVFLVSTRTRDGIVLEGVYAKPARKTKTALVWVHGLSSRFSSGQALIAALSGACKKAGIGYFKFNNRGNNIAVRGSKKQPLIGGGFENFTDCIEDIRATIRFAKNLGYRNMILAGHSTGANKILYYAYKKPDPSVKGIMLLGPISDIAGEQKKIGAPELARRVAIAKALVRKNPNALMPPELKKLISAKRFLSLYQAGKPEDVFPYHHPRARWKELRAIRKPIAAMVGSRDEYLDRPAKKIIGIFRENARSTKSFTGIIIKGAHHGFRNKEKELSKTIIDWIKTLLRFHRR